MKICNTREQLIYPFTYIQSIKFQQMQANFFAVAIVAQNASMSNVLNQTLRFLYGEVCSKKKKVWFGGCLQAMNYLYADRGKSSRAAFKININEIKSQQRS